MVPKKRNQYLHLFDSYVFECLFFLFLVCVAYIRTMSNLRAHYVHFVCTLHVHCMHLTCWSLFFFFVVNEFLQFLGFFLFVILILIFVAGIIWNFDFLDPNKFCQIYHRIPKAKGIFFYFLFYFIYCIWNILHKIEFFSNS